MKKSFFCALMLLGTSTSTVFAANGTVKFTGEIVKSACDLSSDSKNKEVDLGRWPTTALASSGQVTVAKPFTLNLVGCEANTDFALRLDGRADAANSELLALDANSTAKNVGIRVTSIDDKAVFNQSLEDSLQFRSENDQPVALQLKAYYEATGAAVEGLATATANVTVEYK